MRSILIAGSLAFMLVAGCGINSAFAQQGPAVPASPQILTETPLEKAEIESDLKDLVIVQLQFQQQQENLQKLQAQYQTSQSLVDKRVEEAKKAHGWGNDVSFNKQTGKFEHMASPAAASKNAPVKK